MQQPDHPTASRPARVGSTAAAWLGFALVAASGSCAVAPLATAAEPSCPSGQFAATRIEYEGDYNLSPLVDILDLHALAPNVGYKRRTVFVANGYYKVVSEGTIAVAKEEPPGKPVPLPDNRKLYFRELPSRFVIIETSRERLVYDERGDPDDLGTRKNKSKQGSAADEAAIADGLQAMLGPSGGNADVIGKATYAGIPCEVRKFLVDGNTVCIGSVRGRPVTLAEEMQFPHRDKSSWMKAKTKADVCVSAREFEPPANVRFKPTASSASRSQ